MSKGLPEITNPQAELGTAAHELGEHCLKLGLNTYDCLGVTFNDHVVDQNMADAVQVYVTHIRELCSKYGVNPMLEQRVVMRSVRNDVFGTSDCIVIVGEWLFIIDYKHGYGLVEAVDNPQGIFYAIATLDTFELWSTIKYINVTIVQPRPDHKDGVIRSHVYTSAVLSAQVHKYREAIQVAESGQAEPVAGEWCTYCPARANCRARLMRTIEFAYLDKPITDITVEELEVIYNEIKGIKTHCEAIENRCLELARKGKKFKDHKLVKAIQRASCKDEEGFVKAAVKSGVSREKLFKEKLISMTDAKKVLPHDLVNEWFVKPPETTTLEPMTCSRPAISTGSAAGIFEGIK